MRLPGWSPINSKAARSPLRPVPPSHLRALLGEVPSAAGSPRVSHPFREGSGHLLCPCCPGCWLAYRQAGRSASGHSGHVNWHHGYSWPQGPLTFTVAASVLLPLPALQARRAGHEMLEPRRSAGGGGGLRQRASGEGALVAGPAETRLPSPLHPGRGSPLSPDSASAVPHL